VVVSCLVIWTLDFRLFTSGVVQVFLDGTLGDVDGLRQKAERLADRGFQCLIAPRGMELAKPHPLMLRFLPTVTLAAALAFSIPECKCYDQLSSHTDS
jgi:hypothetical protein